VSRGLGDVYKRQEFSTVLAYSAAYVLFKSDTTCQVIPSQYFVSLVS
jgi:hypothetical protein